MAFDSFMGSAASPRDGFQGNGYVSVDATSFGDLGNTEMAAFEKDDSAMNALNAPATKDTFGLAGVQAQAHSLHAPIGDINAKTSEFWGMVALSFGAGVLATVLFNRKFR